jgi:hypothetical protein
MNKYFATIIPMQVNTMKIKWIGFCILCLIQLSYSAPKDKSVVLEAPVQKLRSQILDQDFLGKTQIQIELLENGQTRTVAFSEPFEISLPTDTLFTICATADTLERCYEIRSSLSSQKDSVIAFPLTNQNQSAYYKPLSITAKLEEQFSAAQIQTAEEAPADAVEKDYEESTQLKKVVVRIKKRPKRALGQSTVSAKNIKRMPALAEADIVKAIQALPGVVASSDFSSKIYVRGGGADQNLFLFDNGVVYSPVHFFGLFSTFLVEGVDKLNFYKGGFSPEYGNRLSSVVDIHSREGGKDSSEAWFEKSSVKISTFATQAHTEGHKGDWRWLLAGRVTYLKEILEALYNADISTIKLDYRFVDFQGSLSHKTSETQSEMLSFYAGRDELNFDLIKISWGNVVIPFNMTYKIDELWDLRASYAYSFFFQDFELGEIIGFGNRIHSHTVKPIFAYGGIEDHTVNLGAEVQYNIAAFSRNVKAASLYVNDVKNFWLINPFIEDNWTLGQWDLKSGLRLNYASAIQEYSVEPRFSTRYNIDENRRIDAHTGYYKQFLNSILFNNQETVNEFYYPSSQAQTQEIQPTSSILFSLGYSQDKILDQFDFTLEGYYKTLNNLIVFAPDERPDSVRNNPEATLGDLLITGEGYSYGSEVSIRKNEGWLSGGISYSYGRSILNQNDFIFLAKWDKTHSVKFDANINWKGGNEALWAHKIKGRYFRSSVGVTWSSGVPYTGYSGYSPSYFRDQGNGNQPGGPNPSYPNNLYVPLGGVNGLRYPDYFRFDIKAIDIGREGKWSFAWTILNVTNRNNPFQYTFDTSENPPKRTEIPQFPFFPLLLNYEYYF